MTNRNLTVTARLFFAILTTAAIVTQLTIHIKNNYDVVNFFSYFTNLSNVLAVVVLVLGSYYLLTGNEQWRYFTILRTVATVCMVIVGIVFVLLLRNTDLGDLQPWINVVMHYIMPVIMLIDWIYDPPILRFSFKLLAALALFPLIYLIYSLVRGAIIDWYAYPFLNPDKSGGYLGVGLYCMGILALFLIVSRLLIRVAAKKHKTHTTD